MSRVELALNVTDLEASIVFAIADPPLKPAAAAKAQDAELPAELQGSTTCCHAVQDKVWAHGPDTAWGFYTVLADAPVPASADGCCAVEDAAVPTTAAQGCCA